MAWKIKKRPKTSERRLDRWIEEAASVTPEHWAQLLPQGGRPVKLVTDADEAPAAAPAEEGKPYTHTVRMDADLEPLAAVTVVMVKDPKRPQAPPRFVVGTAHDIQFAHAALMGGLQTLFAIQSHKAGELAGQVEEKQIIVPPAGLTLPPFPGRG